MVELAIPDDAAIEALPNRQAVFLLWTRAGKPFLARTNVLAQATAAFAWRTGPDDRAHRVSICGLAARSAVSAAGTGAEISWACVSRGDPTAAAALREAGAVEPVSAHPGYDAYRARASGLLRSVSQSLDCGAVRIRVSGSVSVAALPGGSDAEPFDIPAASTARWGDACVHASRLWARRSIGAKRGVLAEFLCTSGRSLAGLAESARERMSAEMDFEGAALMHQRLQRIQEVLGLRDEMVREVTRLNAIAVTPSADPDAVELGWLRGGVVARVFAHRIQSGGRHFGVARCAVARTGHWS